MIKTKYNFIECDVIVMSNNRIQRSCLYNSIIPHGKMDEQDI